MEWSGGNGKPVYRDSAVHMFHQSGNERSNLSIDLHPNSQYYSTYVDSSLSGIELFKIAGTDMNLAAPNPDPILPSLDFSPPKHKANEGLSHKTIVGIATTLVFGLAAIFVLLGFFPYRKKEKRVKAKGFDSSHGTCSCIFFSYATTNKSTKTQASSLPSDVCRHFSFVEIKAATRNFDDVFIIGIGGFGNVYKGYVDGGSTLVAIERLNPNSQQGKHEFLTEIEMLSQLRHIHLVSLIGYCYEEGEMILVYDYMTRGTLRDHFYNTTNPPLSWKERLHICIGAARGLNYLHTGAKYAIIHRDMKTANILLDENWVAEVSDFGLPRVGTTSVSKVRISTVVKGTFGYLDPEYYSREQVTEKSDVYSFGVVLFEVLSPRPAISSKAEKKEISLALWAKSCSRNGTIDQIIDPHLTGEVAPKSFKRFCEIALSCLDDEGYKRPSINDVVWGLEFALQLQETVEQGEKNEEGIVAEKMFNDGDSTYLLSERCEEMFSAIEAKSSRMATPSRSMGEKSFKDCDSNMLFSGTLFSELMNAKER